MNFEDAIILAVEQFGQNIIYESNLVNILADLSAYNEMPACKRILTEVVHSGTAQKLFLNKSVITDVEIRQAVLNLNNQFGFQQDLVEYVLCSMRNALNPTAERTQTSPDVEYDYVGSEDEMGFRDVRKNGKWGFINDSNRIVVPIIYDSVGSYHEGLAEVVSCGKWGYVDTKGNVVIPLQYDAGYGFSNDIAKVKLNGKFGMIDKTGKTLLPMEYDSIGYVSNGFVSIQRNGKWGFANTDGRVVIAPQYAEIIKPFSKGYAAVSDGNSVLVINRNGDLIQNL